MANRIAKISTINFGVIPNVSLDSLTNINLFIGENGTEKTFLLKAIINGTTEMIADKDFLLAQHRKA